MVMGTLNKLSFVVDCKMETHEQKQILIISPSQKTNWRLFSAWTA